METSSKAIGGWLILVAFGVLTRPFYLLFSLYPMYREMFTPEKWEILRTAGRMAYGPFFIPFIYTELIIKILFLLATLYQIYLFVTKDYRFPRFFIVLLAASLTFILIDAWIGGIIIEEPIFDSETIGEIMRVVLPSIIWIPYMIYSERVKETFVKR
jgi:hypothetical protein